VTGVQTCALPIYLGVSQLPLMQPLAIIIMTFANL